MTTRRFLAVVWLFSASSAGATELAPEDSVEPPPPPTMLAADEGAFIPAIVPAGTAREAALVRVLGGYDSTAETGVFDSEVRVRLYGPLTLDAGVTYSAATEEMRPRIGAAVQILKQEKTGVDMTLQLSYKAEGFTEPEGEIEFEAALGRRWGNWTGVVNLVYGQDWEARERDGELRLAAQTRVWKQLHVGLSAHTRVDLGSEEGAEPVARGEMDLVAGPVASYAWNRVALFAQVGYSMLLLSDDTVKSGLVAIAGAGTVF